MISIFAFFRQAFLFEYAFVFDSFLRDKKHVKKEEKKTFLCSAVGENTSTMSEKCVPSMDTFPVEILHRIFDHLDLETLFFSLRPLCRYFRSSVHSYERLDFNLEFISKSDFIVLCRLVTPQNIRSLTLYNAGKIPSQYWSFLSQIRLRQLTRLHSIHLHGIEEEQLNELFKHLNLQYLRSISISATNYDNRRRKTTANTLSKILRLANLQTVEFQVDNSRLSDVQWPSNCSIECLILNGNTQLDKLIQIYSSCPRLNRLIVKEEFAYFVDSPHVTLAFPQLTSLIVQELNVTIDQLEQFLLSTPSLVHLKLIGNCQLFDGKRWEHFIQLNLSHLNRFQFDIECETSKRQTQEDLELILQSYRTSFWIQFKKWFITLQFDQTRPFYYRIYSLPFCHSSYRYFYHSEIIFLSTSNQICPTINISQLTLDFYSSFSENLFASNRRSLPNLTKLHLFVQQQLHTGYYKYLRQIIDFTQLIEIHITCCSFVKDDELSLYDLLKLLQKSNKLKSFRIDIYPEQYPIYPFLDQIIKLLPPQIKHLNIAIKEAKQIQSLFQRFQHLAILEFPLEGIERPMDIEQWFHTNTSGSNYRKHVLWHNIWIGNKYQTQQNFNPKRMKLNHRQTHN